MGTLDLARLRNQTMADGQDSEVTVNTRALIDKVLARYSTEHTTLRELIQNASDAGATSVSIKFETDPSLSIPTPAGSESSVLLKHIIQHHTLKRLVVSNNGQPFTNADWSRLKSIADGNPDETKIGAFGVGFYSVFADCDQPFVISDDRTMAFYWKGNTLSTKVANVPEEHRDKKTTFSLDYRQADRESSSYNPAKIPDLPSLCQFLATSLTFVGLQQIVLLVDDFCVLQLEKKTSAATNIRLPQDLKTETEGGFMRVAQVSRQHSQIDAVWSNVIATAQNPPKGAAELVQAEVRNAGSSLKSFFSKFSANAGQTQVKSKRSTPETMSERALSDTTDTSGDSKATIFLQVCNVEVDTRVSRSFAAEIERATKKPPPKRTKVALLTSPYYESSTALSNGSGSTVALASKMFAEVLPTKSGRIFIGFPTAQTTGFLAHVSAPSLIPTVERENVDLNARYIATWNIELLRVAGLACRITYSSELASIHERYQKEPIEDPISRTVYVFQQFTASASHPSTLLGEKIEEAFWHSSKERSIEILSSKGVMASKLVRMPAETLSFLGEVPMVPQELATKAYSFMVGLHKRGFISELTMADIRRGLESRALSEDELVEFLKWCGAKIESSELDVGGVHNLFEITVANIGIDTENKSGRILSLGDIDSYINAAKITPTMPIPPETIHFQFSKAVSLKQLQLFGWVELSMIRWLRFMTNAPQLQEFISSEKVAAAALSLTAKAWESLDAPSKEAIVNLLRSHPVVPTKAGMRKPEEAYFPNVKLFDDLPTVKPFPGSKDKFLLALGIRRTVDLPVVFDRMRNSDGKATADKTPWNHADLIRYFASVLDEMPKRDLDRLRETAFLLGEGKTVRSGQLHKASALYAPHQAIIAMGLTQIMLPFDLKASSREAMLLYRLGLKEWPNTSTIANALFTAGKSNDKQLYDSIIQYYLQNFFKHGYASEIQQWSTLAVPILPTEQAPFPTLVGSFQCFVNEQAACLGYAILRADLRPHAEKFGVRRDPDIKDCVQRMLKSPPETKVDAEMQFAYLAGRAAVLEKNQTLLASLTTSRIIPIFRKYYVEQSSVGFEDRTRLQTGRSEMRFHHHDPPDAIFVGQDQEWRGILDYVQYGSEATSFLLKAGAKHEPSSHDLASLLARNPTRFLTTIGTERYLELLRKLAERAGDLWKDKDLVKTLVASRILLGYRDVKDDSKKLISIEEDSLDDIDEPGMQREWSLNLPSDLAIVDDVSLMMKFRDFVIAAPQEEILEDFYARLGVRKVSDLVKQEQRVGTPLRDQSPAQQLRKDILERARLFLHEYERDASSKSVRHDARWLTGNLAVQCVSDIAIRYSLADRNIASSSRRTAAISRNRTSGTVLHITPKYDVYDVSRALVTLLIRRPKQNDAIALERILTESLRRLQEKGINVERILRKKEYEARIAKQQELEREYEEQQQAAEQAKSGIATAPDMAPPATPEKPHGMPGSFGSPEAGSNGLELADSRPPPAEKNVFNQWAKKLGFNKPNLRPALPPTNGPQINRDIQATRSNIQSAIKECRPTDMEAINTQHHQDPTELDKGGYCNGEQWENLRKAFTIPFSGRNVDIYYGHDQTEAPSSLSVPLDGFLPLIFHLTALFGVNPAAVNIFLDAKSNTVAFNMGGSLFFNLAWFQGLHEHAYNAGTEEGRTRALDSWFFTYCHELAHNLVREHDARHSWYQQQIAIEFSQAYRKGLAGFLEGSAR